MKTCLKINKDNDRQRNWVWNANLSTNSHCVISRENNLKNKCQHVVEFLELKTSVNVWLLEQHATMLMKCTV